MAVDRKGAYEALREHLQAHIGDLLAQPVRRRVPGSSEVVPTDQPMVAVVALSDERDTDGPAPAVTTLQALAVIYARCDEDPELTAQDVLFDIVGAIDDALEPNAGSYPDGMTMAPGQLFQGWSTLGGKAVWVRPAGPVLYTLGQIEQQGQAQYPIELLVRPT